MLVHVAQRMVLAQQLIAKAPGPSMWLLPLLALQSVWTSAPDDLPWINSVRHVTACWPPSHSPG